MVLFANAPLMKGIIPDFPRDTAQNYQPFYVQFPGKKINYLSISLWQKGKRQGRILHSFLDKLNLYVSHPSYLVSQISST